MKRDTQIKLITAKRGKSLKNMLGVYVLNEENVSVLAEITTPIPPDTKFLVGTTWYRFVDKVFMIDTNCLYYILD